MPRAPVVRRNLASVATLRTLHPEPLAGATRPEYGASTQWPVLNLHFGSTPLAVCGHCTFGMVPIGAAAQVVSQDPALAGSPSALPEFEELYDTQVGFVWRNARRLGVPDSALDDVVQDVFLVAHRRLTDLEQPESLRAWILSILVRVVRDYRRTLKRKDPRHRSAAATVDPAELADPRAVNPQEAAEHTDAVRLLYAILSELDDAKREVFVFAELEEMTEKEIAEALGENANTVHSRLRAARRDFDRAVHRYRKSIERRLP